MWVWTQVGYSEKCNTILGSATIDQTKVKLRVRTGAWRMAGARGTCQGWTSLTTNSSSSHLHRFYEYFHNIFTICMICTICPTSLTINSSSSHLHRFHEQKIFAQYVYYVCILSFCILFKITYLYLYHICPTSPTSNFYSSHWHGLILSKYLFNIFKQV